MYNKIIVEGPNNVGKTTFINMLLSSDACAGWSVEHVTSAAPNDLEFYTKTLATGKNVIFDRHCIGELVYPKLYGRPANVSLTDVKKLLKSYRDELLVIFIDADYTFIANACSNKDEIFMFDNVRNERDAFKNLRKEFRGTNVIELVNHIDATYYDEADLKYGLSIIKNKLVGDWIDDICE